jgi:rhamnosyltransferase
MRTSLSQEHLIDYLLAQLRTLFPGCRQPHGHTPISSLPLAQATAVLTRSMNIAISIVLYYPDEGIIAKIRQYAEYLDVVIVVDNTDNGMPFSELNDIPNVAYRALGKNVGMAAALNVAAKMAIERKCSWMMMLDQDSKLDRSLYESITSHIIALGELRLGIAAPVQVSKPSDLPTTCTTAPVQDVNYVMTSGSVMNLEAFQQCGPFEDKLFIDHVDHEYCLRLLRRGYRVVQFSRLVLSHSLGETQSSRFFGKDFEYVNHRPFRSYYQIRNGFYVSMKFLSFRPQFFVFFLIHVVKSVSKAIFFQSDKLMRFKMMARGFLHFCTGRYGPL